MTGDSVLLVGRIGAAVALESEAVLGWFVPKKHIGSERNNMYRGGVALGLPPGRKYPAGYVVRPGRWLVESMWQPCWP